MGPPGGQEDLRDKEPGYRDCAVSHHSGKLSPGLLLSPSCNICQGTAEDVNTAVEAAAQAFVSWSKLTGYQRAKHLYSVARHVQKHARLVAVVEALDNGKSIRETRDADSLVVVRHLYHYAGWAQLMSEQMSAWASIGVIGAIVPWNFPLMLLVWKVAPALAMGRSERSPDRE